MTDPNYISSLKSPATQVLHSGARQANKAGHADSLLKAHSRELGQRQQLMHAKLHQAHPTTKAAGTANSRCQDTQCKHNLDARTAPLVPKHRFLTAVVPLSEDNLMSGQIFSVIKAVVTKRIYCMPHLACEVLASDMH